MVLLAALQKLWGTKELLHTYFNPKTALALKQATSYVKEKLAEHIGQVSGIEVRTSQKK